MTTALSKQQASDLRACEAVIVRGIKTFREVGMALAKIRDERLYREDFKTFADYCQDRFKLSKSHAYRMIEAAGTPEVSPTGDAIDTEHKARKYLDEQKQEPVTDDDDQADGGAEPVTSGPLAGMEPDPVGVPSTYDGFKDWLAEVVRRHWDNDNGELTLPIMSNALFWLSEEVMNWKE